MQPRLIPLDIFFCLQFFIPLLFIVSRVRIGLPYLNLKALIIATNITLLIAAMLSVFIPVIELGMAYFSEEGGGYYKSSIYGLFTCIIIPQIMWIRRVRRSIISSCVWLAAYWLFSTVLIKYIRSSWVIFTPDMHWFDYAKQVLIFLMVIVPVYLLVNSRYKHVPEVNG